MYYIVVLKGTIKLRCARLNLHSVNVLGGKYPVGFLLNFKYHVSIFKEIM